MSIYLAKSLEYEKGVTALSKQSDGEELADAIIEIGGRPVNTWAVAAMLESMGIRDVDAVDDYGKKDIFDLATDVFQRCLTRLKHQLFDREKDQDLNSGSGFARFLRFYSSGLMFAMPMAGQIALLFILRYSLWAYIGFTELQATVIASGTILGFIVTGGFVQSIARRGLFYLEQKLYTSTRDVCLHIIKVGTITVFVVALIAYLINLVFPFFTQQMIGISLLYFILTSHLWMSMSLLYTLKKRLVILLVTLLGVGVIYVVLELISWDIMPAQWLGLLITVSVMYTIGYITLTRLVRRTEGTAQQAKLPRQSILVYAVRHYFVFGTLYFTYLFLDRLVGWSSSTGADVPYRFWFRVPYELGMDWALLSFILTVAGLEYTIREFSKIMIPEQKRFPGWKILQHNRYFTRFYLRHFVLLVATAIISIILVYYGGIWAQQNFPQVKLIQDFFANPLTFNIFWIGAIGYALTTIGLLNVSFFFTLSRPTLALQAIVPALGLNMIVGFVLSRAISYEFSVYGLAVGALVFAVVSTIRGWRLMHSLDYYYYSAY